jgi:polyisoprenoid-binding protein YceI
MALVAMMYSTETLAVDKYAIDHPHTTVGFSVKHMVITSVKGKFNEFDGAIMYDENDLTKTAVTGSIAVASINTGNEKRDSHLKSEEFFHAEKHPEITFASKRVIKREDGYVMIGDLTMRGVTKEIEIPFQVVGKITDPMGNIRIGIQARATINRQDFGVSWSKALEGGGLIVGNDVKIELDVEAIMAKE